MSPDSSPTLVIAGGGTAGWITAAVLSKALAGTQRIVLVESEEIGTIGVGEATIPQIQHLLNYLGFTEGEFLRAVSGSIKLGIEFSDWGAIGERYIHAFGDIGVGVGIVPFYHHWLRARALGETRSLWDFCLNAQAAAANACEAQGQSLAPGLAGLRHAYHLDAGLLAQVLRRQAEARGVIRVEGRILGAVRDGETGMVRHLALEDGREIGGDLFIDCTGFRALLIAEAMGVGFEDWNHVLPCDRALAMPTAPGPRFRPFTQAMARPAGWQWRIPLQHRVGNGHVYASAFMEEAEAEALLRAHLEAEPLAEPLRIRFRAGMRAAAWSGNVIAVGLSGGFLEPLESTSIHLIQSAVNRIIALWPGRPVAPPLIAEFNRQTRFEYETIRDFIILHYKATRRDDTPFWRHCRDMAVPDTLTQKMALFAQSARIRRDHDELFTEQGWLQVLVGQGVIPAHWHGMADTLEPARLKGFLDDLDTLVRRAVAAMPDHAAYVQRACAAP